MKLPLALVLTAALVAAPAFSQPAKPAATTSPAPRAEIFELNQLDKAPKPLEQPLPVYPTHLRFTNVQGQAILRFVVDASGATRDIEVLKTDHADFATAAVESVKQWRFKPALKARLPVSCRMEMPVVFSLTSN